MFSKVTFKAEQVHDSDFYKIATKEIIPEFKNSDATVSFDKIKIKSKNWSDVNTSDV